MHLPLAHIQSGPGNPSAGQGLVRQLPVHDFEAEMSQLTLHYVRTSGSNNLQVVMHRWLSSFYCVIFRSFTNDEGLETYN